MKDFHSDGHWEDSFLYDNDWLAFGERWVFLDASMDLPLLAAEEIVIFLYM